MTVTTTLASQSSRAFVASVGNVLHDRLCEQDNWHSVALPAASADGKRSGWRIL